MFVLSYSLAHLNFLMIFFYVSREKYKALKQFYINNIISIPSTSSWYGGFLSIHNFIIY